MAIRKRMVGSLSLELLAKSREAALCAIRVFNDPSVTFKSETFIVLMNIAWTYMLHAYYRRKSVEYRYFTKVGKRRSFDRTKTGAYKYWELERCLNDKSCPIDKDAANNLRFLIKLRHEIEHQMTRSLDGYLSGRYQACALNYNEYIKKLFGKRFGLDSYLTYSIQFVELTGEQINGPNPEASVPERLRAYIAEFDAALTHDEYNSPRFSYRLLFKKKLVNRPGQADRVIEFIDPHSELAKTIDKEYWVKKEVERPKFNASSVVAEVRKAGFPKFKVHHDHTNMWKRENAKDPGKGFGVQVEGSWLWYDTWINRCIEICKDEGDKYT
ncbi:hypothetical protein A7X64_08000 [Stenotrophomonas maltophilia]|uniref:DUF3644 domain-containing protein n=1 Tax=Stenotrophomonas maltophilia TaxID=40324 RepID=UPI000DA8F31E|nr:DUF3644 domain-containing protein [Stenotrophomonas maltophilia]PZS62946.1 hypothetical protein A7X64_08000 [Stenotrophomonas maltophilia]